MSKRGAKYTTAFNTEETAAIQAEIERLAIRHNNLIRPADIDISQWRQVILPPDVRDLAVKAEREYHGLFTDTAYYCMLPVRKQRHAPEPDGFYYEFGGSAPSHNSAMVQFDWKEAGPGRFPQGASNAPSMLYDDAYPRLVSRITEAILEWGVSATNYGLVLDVFNWINNFCLKGDRQHARNLLPGLVPLIGKFNPDLARRLAAPSSGIRRPVPEEYVAGIQRANQIIAEGLMLPNAPASSPAVRMWLYYFDRSSWSGWPQPFKSIVDLT